MKTYPILTVIQKQTLVPENRDLPSVGVGSVKQPEARSYSWYIQTANYADVMRMQTIAQGSGSQQAVSVAECHNIASNIIEYIW